MNKVSARKALEFTRVTAKDGCGRVTEVLVPGHDCSTYRVVLDRIDWMYVTRCYKQPEHELQEQSCKGNSNETICYHALAALMRTAQEQGKRILFTDTEDAARHLENLGGRAYQILSAQGRGTAWMVVKGNLQR